MPGCPIIRPVKHKDAASLRGAMAHHLRTIPTANADPERRHLNRVLIGPPTPGKVARKAIDRAEPLAKRKDANRAIELFLGASDQYWEGGGDHVALGDALRGFLEAEFGAENVIGMGVHLDENKPHFWAIITPIHEGKLTSAHWFDGPAKLAALHDRIADHCKHLGMERARRGVKQTHLEMATLHQANAGNPSAIAQVSREIRRRLRQAEARADALIVAAKGEAATIIAKASRTLQKALERDESSKARARQLDTLETSLKARETSVQELAAALSPIEEERAAMRLAIIKEEGQKGSTKRPESHPSTPPTTSIPRFRR